MVETAKETPSSGNHSGSNPNNIQNIDELMREVRGDGNSFGGNSDMRTSARLSKLLGRGEMNLELDDLINLDHELLKS